MSDMPWDNAHLLGNLQTLARLKAGNELSVLKDGAVPREEAFRDLGKKNRGLRHDFKIRTGGVFGLGKKIARDKKGENLLADKQYKTPLSRIFQAGRAALDEQRLGITAAHMRSAHRGLRNLVKTYASWGMTHQNKIQEILQVTAAHLPGFAVIDIKGKGTTELLRRYGFMNLSQEIVADMDYKTDSTVGVEADMPQMGIRNVYGRDRGERVTAIPTENQTGTTTPVNYRRQKSGICKAAAKDWKRNGFKLNGEEMLFPFTESSEALSRESWRKLLKVYEAVGCDDGMLYVASQCLNQGGLTFLISQILVKRRRGGGPKEDFRSFGVNGFGISPSTVRPYYSMETDGRVVRCSVEYVVHTKRYTKIGETALNIPTLNIVKVDEPMIMGFVFPQFIGINALSFTLSVDLERRGTAIHMRLAEFKIDHDIARVSRSADDILACMGKLSDAKWVQRFCS